MKQFVLFLPLAISVFAQSQTGRITGKISDPTGAAIPSAEVIASEQDTGVNTRGVSSATGVYAIPFLPPGRYRVVASHAGFKKYDRPNVAVGTSEVVPLDIQLELGNVAEQVTVEATTQLLESSTSDVGQTIDAKTVADMPLNGRRALSLVALSAATVWVSYGGEAKPNFSLAGGRVQSQMFWLDGGGGQNMRMGVGQVDIDPPVEVIREFRVVQNTYSAEFGGSAGGLIISTTKSGTNQFHGSAFEYFRNDKMDARNFFAAGKPALRYNLFGATAGGPIRRNKTHFFAGIEETRKSTGAVDVLTVPTPEQRRGDFSQTTNANGVLQRIFDPGSNRLEGGRNVRDQFPGNVIPAARIDPVAAKLIEYWPLPNRTPINRAGASNFGGNYSTIFKRDNFTARIDHAFSDANRFYFRYLFNRDPLTNTSVYPNPIANTRNSSKRHQNIFLFADTHTLTPNLIVDARLSISDRTFHNASPGLGTDPAQLLGLRGVPSGAFPQFTVPSVSTLGSGTHERIQIPIRQQQYVSSWTWVRSSHVIKFGGEFRRSTNTDILRTSLSGQFGFSTQPTALEGTANTGFGLASMLVGFPNSLTLRATDALERKSNYLAGYFQDDWKVSNRLTLNLGVRWETDTPMVDRNNRMNGFDLAAINPVSRTPGVVRFAGLDGFPAEPYATDWNNFGPRIGFAYKAGANDKMVIRGGFGVAFAHPFDHGVPNANSLGFEKSAGLSTPDNGVTAPFLLRNGVPAINLGGAELNDRFGAVPVGANPTTNINFFEQNRQTGYAQQFNLSIQREVAGMFVEAGYVGNLSRKLSLSAININQISPNLINAIRPAGVFRQGFRPFPQFNNVSIQNPTFGVTDYHAGTLKLEKRFSGGASIHANYTWSKNLGNIDDAPEDLGAAQQYSDYYNRRADKGPSGLDITHRFTWSSLYELPFGKGRKLLSDGALARVVGGWSLGGIAVLQSAGAFTVVTQTNTTNVFPAGGQRANVLRDPNLPNSEKTLDRWFDTSAFALPDAFTFGNAGRGIIRADGRIRFDFSLVKNVNFSESRFLQLRGEVFNAFNHADFGVAGSSIGGPGFGVISAATDARVLQLGLRFVF
ncbi:MAG: carboxypeptidase regulatory-like domain-containing protein [Bryobacteraceae bacterium]